MRWLFPIDKVLNSLPDPTPLFDISCGPCTSKLRTSVEPQIQKVKNAEEIVLPVLLLSAYQAVCSDASAHLQTQAPAEWVRESALQGCNSLHPRSVDSLPLVEGDGNLRVKRLGPLGKEVLENGEAPHGLIHGANN